MKVLVTGGAGYVGSNLCDALIDRGDRVAVLDNLSTGSTANIAHLLDRPGFTFVRGSILDSTEMEGLIREADQVYHLAAAVGVRHIIQDPLGSMRTNIAGTERVLDLCHRYRKRTLIVSSSEVYGKSDGRPLKEDDDRVLGPTSVNRWSYSASKAIDEHLAYAYAAEGLPVSIVRYFNSYGPRVAESGYGSVVANFIRQALAGEDITVHGDGSQTRSFCFVADTVRGTILACDLPDAVADVFNIGSECEVSILDLAQMVRDMSGSRSRIVFIPARAYYGKSYEDTARRRPDTTKSARVLGFRASVTLHEGLRRTIAWARMNYRTAQAAERMAPVLTPAFAA
jgi:UDP-glucose 4-epimerase